MTSIEETPENAQSLVIEIVNFLLRGNHDAAIDTAGRLAAQSPEDVTTFFMMGVIAHSMGDNGRAIELISDALERGPEYREFADMLAVLHTKEGHVGDGLYFAKLAGTLDPHPYLGSCLPGNLTNYFTAIGNIRPSEHHIAALRHLLNREFAKAIQSADRELRINPRNGAAYGILGQARLASGDAGRAAIAFRGALHLEPDEAAHRLNLACSLYRSGRHWEALGCFKEALLRDRQSVDAPLLALAEAAYLGGDGIPMARTFREELAARLKTATAEFPPSERSASAATKFRIGILCNTLFTHEQANVLLAVMPQFAKVGAELTLYQQSIATDGVTTSLKTAANGYRVVHNIDDDTFAAIVEGDGIDLLLDLCEPSEGDRLLFLARRPAVLQAGWLGRLGGAGIPCFDAVVTDRILEPTDASALAANQRLVVIERGIFALSPFTLYPEPGISPCRENGMVTFGAEADLGELTPETVSAWVRVLKAVPQSRLLLAGPCAATPTARERTVDCFANFGAITHIAFWDGAPPSVSDPTFFQAIDVFLDGMTISGGLRIADMLWMGVPALTVAGTTRASRLGASVLTSAGKSEWAATSVDEFVEAARQLTADLESLAGIRAGLRSEVSLSSLFDPTGFAKSFIEAILTAAPQFASRWGLA